MTAILGISALYHDSAAALVVDGEIVAAAQEERFTRKKHDASFPRQAIDFCLKEGKLTAGQLDHVVFYDKPLLKFDRLLETYLGYAPRGLGSFLLAMPPWLKQKLHLPRELRKLLGKEYGKRFLFTGHHESHAASAFYPSPFEEAAILTVDGVGEWDTATIAEGRGNRLTMRQSLRFPASLGLLYSAFTYFCGFRVNSGEYKLMGLAPYGKPKYKDLILEHLIDLREDGSFGMDQRYFDYCSGLRMTSGRFARLFGGSPRQPESALTQREMDLAASVQAVTEEVLLRMARHARELTGLRNLCLAGGVALNCVANGKLLREGILDDIWIQPAAGDAGGALGAALFVHYQLRNQLRTARRPDAMQGAYLGPRYSNASIQSWLEAEGVPFALIEEESLLLAAVVDALDSGQVVGWFQGRMEFGPRALGGRSILGDPRNTQMQATMNLKIKYRESFRPFAPSVLDSARERSFALERASPYMLLVAQVQERIQKPVTEGTQAADLRSRVNQVRSEIPAVTHVDYSARVQTVDARNGRYERLLRAWEARTGCGLLVNTSFNVRGEPIVCTPQDAYRCFMATEMDVLVLENCLLLKKNQPARDKGAREAHVGQFALD